jgi:hypothetical protein
MLQPGEGEWQGRLSDKNTTTRALCCWYIVLLPAFPTLDVLI